MNNGENAPSVTAVSEIDGRGAHPKSKPPRVVKKSSSNVWYVAYVVPNHEKKANEYLKKFSYTTFLPIQPEMVERGSGKKVLVDRLVIPMLLFIKPPKGVGREDLMKLDRLSFIVTVMKLPGSRELAKIPEVQITNFRKLLEKSQQKIVLETGDVKTGDKVRIRFGKLKGLVGEIERSTLKSPQVIVRIDYIGFARIEVNVEDLEFLD